MSNRTTIKQLEAKVARLNSALGQPQEPYKKGTDGKYRAQVGCYTIDQSYSSYALERIVTEGGGVTRITYGRHTKRELADILDAMLQLLYVEKLERDREAA